MGRSRAHLAPADLTAAPIFVCGTLLRGEAAHTLVAASTLVSATRTAPKFTLYDLGAYPALVAGGKDAVYGEVYQVDGAVLAALDFLERPPRFLRRTRIPLADGSRVYAYLLDRDRVDGYARLASGDWRQRQAERNR
jgi:gamma-glutamylaminecyclotransferase